MHINPRRIRSLYTNSEGKKATMPTRLSASSTAPTHSKINVEQAAVSAGLTRSDQKILTPNVRVGQETAASNTGSTSSSLSGLGPMAPLLTGYLETKNGQDQQGNDQGVDTGMYELYRDLYDHDAVCGQAVDLMSNMPFSDFTLSGTKESKYLAKYEESIDNTRARSLFPMISVEYLVVGLFCSTTLFDKDEKVYKGLIPQNADFVEVTPTPMWGHDPLISLRIGDALSKLKSLKNDPRVDSLLAQMPEEYQKADKKTTFQPKPEDVIYIPRSGLLRDTRGISVYQRIIPWWLMEKALYRGTLDQALKRQKSVSHMVVGDDEWEPTTTEMQQLAQMLLQADQDPVGAIFVTRQGVSVSDIRTAGDFWKVSDLNDFFTSMKLRAMGISESFLSGDATYNSLEQVMSVFVEQMRAYREKVTSEVFYERMFPRISQENGYSNKRQGLPLELASFDRNQMQLPLGDNPIIPAAFAELAAERQSYGKISYRNRDALIPQVHWHKRLRPEADDAYLQMLTTLSTQGVPIPVRLWAAAGGIDLQSLVNQKDEDMRIRDNLQDWVKEIAKSVAAALPPMEGGGGEMPGAPDGGGDEFASLIGSSLGHKPKAILSRDYGDQYETQNRGGDGKRHLFSTKGRQIADEKINRIIAAAAAETNKKINAFEDKMDKQFRELNSKIKYYTSE